MIVELPALPWWLTVWQVQIWVSCSLAMALFCFVMNRIAPTDREDYWIFGTVQLVGILLGPVAVTGACLVGIFRVCIRILMGPYKDRTIKTVRFVTTKTVDIPPQKTK